MTQFSNFDLGSYSPKKPWKQDTFKRNQNPKYIKHTPIYPISLVRVIQ
jgi:hypothetical protein